MGLNPALIKAFENECSKHLIPVARIGLEQLVFMLEESDKNILYLTDAEIHKKIYTLGGSHKPWNDLFGDHIWCYTREDRANGYYESWMPARNTRDVMESINYLTSSECDEQWDIAYIPQEFELLDIAELI